MDQLRDGGNGRFGDHTGLSRDKKIERGLESRDGRLGNTVGLHLGLFLITRNTTERREGNN